MSVVHSFLSFYNSMGHADPQHLFCNVSMELLVSDERTGKSKQNRQDPENCKQNSTCVIGISPLTPPLESTTHCQTVQNNLSLQLEREINENRRSPPLAH